VLCVLEECELEQAEEGKPYLGIRHGTRDSELLEFSGMTCENRAEVTETSISPQSSMCFQDLDSNDDSNVKLDSLRLTEDLTRLKVLVVDSSSDLDILN